MNWNNYTVCFFLDNQRPGLLHSDTLKSVAIAGQNAHHPPPAAAFFKVMVTTQDGHKVFFFSGLPIGQSNAAQRYEIRFIANVSAVITEIILS